MNLIRFHASLDLALTYSLRRPKLARSLAMDALDAGVRLGRPDLTYRASELLGALS